MTVLDYGEVPLAGCFPTEEELHDNHRYDLKLMSCPKCRLLQTASFISPEALFRDYRYMASIGSQGHFNDLALWLQSTFDLDKESQILEIGSNDGGLLEPLQNLDLNPIGFEPSDNISDIARERGCTIIHDFFSADAAREYCDESSVDLVVSCHCLAHIPEILDAINGIHYVLKEDGHLVMEVHYAKALLKDAQYDVVYHEHVYYHSITSLDYLFKSRGMTITACDELDTHAGSIRVTAVNKSISTPSEVLSAIDAELPFLKSVEVFGLRSLEHGKRLVNTLKDMKKSGNKIVGYGAAGRGNLMLSFLGIGPELIDYVVDEAPTRIGRFINNIPIVDKSTLINDKDISVVFIIAWSYSDMIMDKLKDVKTDYLIPFPEPVIINNKD
jgi:SAM-dependent methyltransferase